MNYLYPTILLVAIINIIGYLYSYLIVTNKIGFKRYIQPNIKRNTKYLLSHTYLFIINVITLLFFIFVGLYFFKDFIINPDTHFSYLIFLVHLFIILIFDDTFFYFLHRLMHENKYIYKKIHKIHHRAYAPIPIDYIYVHPLEWMSGFIGPFIGILLLGGVHIYTFWIYIIIRNIHELMIHSGIETSFIKFPFYGTNEHHDIHHSKRNGNYASTFTFWDILLKTKLKKR